MVQSFICLLLSIIAYITVYTLQDSFAFLSSWLVPLFWIMIGFAVLLAVIVIIKIIKEIRK